MYNTETTEFARLHQDDYVQINFNGNKWFLDLIFIIHLFREHVSMSIESMSSRDKVKMKQYLLTCQKYMCRVIAEL